MKQTKKSVFLRYEFSNEAGQLEGGDIFEFPSNREAIAMSADILKIASQDGVAVHITVGAEKPFYGLLKLRHDRRADRCGKSSGAFYRKAGEGGSEEEENRREKEKEVSASSIRLNERVLVKRAER